MTELRDHPYIKPGREPISIPPWPPNEDPSTGEAPRRNRLIVTEEMLANFEPSDASVATDHGEIRDNEATFEIDPLAAIPFKAAPRAGHVFTDSVDGDLAADILANGVVEPVIVWNDGAVDRLICGNRRLAVVRHLRELGHNIALPARRANVVPTEAIVMAHSSNTGRERPTAMQQARAVAWAISDMGISQAAVAALLRFGESKVSRLLVLANLPDWILARATNPDQLSELFAAQLQGELQNANAVEQMKARAALLEEQNRTLSGARLARHLLTGSAEREITEVCDHAGRVLVRMSVNPKGAITLKVPPIYLEGGFDHATIMEAARVMLMEAMAPPS